MNRISSLGRPYLLFVMDERTVKQLIEDVLSSLKQEHKSEMATLKFQLRRAEAEVRSMKEHYWGIKSGPFARGSGPRVFNQDRAKVAFHYVPLGNDVAGKPQIKTCFK